MTIGSSTILPQKDKQTEDRVRGEQIHAMERNATKALLGYLLGVVMTVVIFYPTWGILIVGWGVATCIACAPRLLRAYRTMTRPVTPHGPRAIGLAVDAAIVLSVVMPSGPIWIALHSDGFASSYMTLFVVSTLWGSALVHILVLEVAAVYVVVQSLMWSAFSLQAGMNWNRAAMMGIFWLVALVALEITRQLSNRFETGLRQQIQLEVQSAELNHQTEVIGLLLKEHEQGSSDWMWQIRASLEICNPSSRFADAFCRLPGDIDGLPLTDLLRGPGEQPCAALLEQIAARRSFRDLVVPGSVGGEPRWWSLSGHPVNDESSRFVGYRGVMADVTAARQAQAQVAHLAHHDALTDLPNRAYFHQRLEATLRTIENGRLAVIGIDLDGFKPVNDRYGHFAGDALLVAVAQRLQSEVAESDLVARLGGDEFAIKTRTTDTTDMEGLCRRLLKALSTPFCIDGHEITVGASIGVAFAPTGGVTANTLLRNADAALYRAKHDGRGTFRFFAADMDQALQERILLSHDLRDALKHGELVVYYQPFIDAGTGLVTGCEALIRWQHPTRGLVSPLEFIPLAEESGLIVQIGAWVIETACAEAASWPGDRRVSVNLSPVQFRDHNLPDHILSALLAAGLPAHRLEVELTETVLVTDAEEALALLGRIRALGVKVALDDFGTGYSSLSYLRSFPFDKIKIDRSFVRELGMRNGSEVIVEAVHHIARGLHMTITAEGVETAEQEALLQLTGCHELQGFLYSRPCSVQDLAQVWSLGSLLPVRSVRPSIGARTGFISGWVPEFDRVLHESIDPVLGKASAAAE